PCPGCATRTWSWSGIRRGIKAGSPAGPSSSSASNKIAMNAINATIIEAQVIEALRSCFDPEIPVNIYELGLVYEVTGRSRGEVTMQMTLASPHCPAVQSRPAEIETKVKAVDGVSGVKTDLVWDP